MDVYYAYSRIEISFKNNFSKTGGYRNISVFRFYLCGHLQWLAQKIEPTLLLLVLLGFALP